MTLVRDRLEEIQKKYRAAKRVESNIVLLLLKNETESFIGQLQNAEEKFEDLLAEGQDILIDLIRTIEEGHYQPFRPKKL